jgi:tetratricopeptide (TPR) repeat protein
MNLGESMRRWRKVVALAGAAPESTETVALAQTARLWILGLGWRFGMSAEEAEAIVAEGKATAEQTGDLTSRALLNVPYGIILAAAGQVERHVELCFEALRLADESGVRTVQLEARSMLYGLWLNGRLTECLTVAEEGIELTGGDPTTGLSFANLRSRLAFFTWFRGFVLASIGRLDEASSDIERAIGISRDQDDVEMLCRGRNAQVWLARYTGEAQLAVERGRQAVEIAEAIGSPFTLVHSYEALGLVHLLTGEWNEALAACEQAHGIVLERGANREFLPRILTSFAEAHLGRGDVGAARRTAHEAVQLARDDRFRLFEVGAELTLGRVLLQTGGAEDGEAEAVLTHALALAEEIEARSEEPLIRLELAELARLTGDEAALRRELQEAHRLCSEIGATARVDQIARQLGLLASASSG